MPRGTNGSGVLRRNQTVVSNKGRTREESIAEGPCGSSELLSTHAEVAMRTGCGLTHHKRRAYRRGLEDPLTTVVVRFPNAPEKDVSAQLLANSYGVLAVLREA
jgi:hypothetical protein